jgi:L-asparaginase II
MLAQAELDGSALECGAHWPSNHEATIALARRGGRPSALHNNCSGKHSGMLSACRFMGVPLESYLKPSHPLQKANLRNLSRFAEIPTSKIPLGVDGCSAPTFAIPLRAMARAIASFAAAPGTPQRVRDAMMAHPAMVGRPCVTLMTAAPGHLLAKGGAEGVYIAAIPKEKKGIAFKVDDGGARAWTHVLHAVLRKLGWLGKEDLDRLRRVADPILKNHAGTAVGEIRVRF